jgi:hypothetical protein
MSDDLPIHTPRPRPHRDPRRWLMQIADDHPVYFRDLPRELRTGGIQALMRMCAAGTFPKYFQLVKGGKRFWRGKDIKLFLASQAHDGEGVPS